MPIWKQALLSRYHAPAGDDGADTGGTATLDRGDDFMADIDPDDPDGELAAAAEKSADKPVEKAEDPKAQDDDADNDDAADDKPRAKGQRIPLNRHKEILAKERAQREALEQRLAQYEKGQQIAQTNDELTKIEDSILQMEKQYNSLLADGDIEKASALMSKIRQAERSIVETKAEMRAQAAEIRARESARYDIVLERIEEAYPVLDPESDTYDSETLTDVADLKQVYQNRGMTPTKALQAAVKKLLGQGDRSQKSATEVAPRVSEKDIAAERKKGAVAKTVDATRRTPPSTRDIGMDSDKAGGGLSPKDVMAMSQDEFSKLTDEQLARMRGDIV